MGTHTPPGLRICAVVVGSGGFPNGRGAGYEVVDVSLRVAMDAFCMLTGEADTWKVSGKPANAPAAAALIGVIWATQRVATETATSRRSRCTQASMHYTE